MPDGLPCISFPVSPPEAIARYEGWDAVSTRNTPLSGEVSRAPDELATLSYTSGTTGMPKGVMHSFGNFAWALETGIRRIPINADDRVLSCLPLAHLVERVLVEQGWMRTGMHLYAADSLEAVAADLQCAGPTIFFPVPRLWLKFQHGVHHKLPPERLDRLLAIPLIEALGRCWPGTGASACRSNEGYGLTENLAVSHLTVPGQNQEGTVGPAYDGVDIRIDPRTGEVQMRSAAVMQRHHRVPEQTRDTFTVDGWLGSDVGGRQSARITRQPRLPRRGARRRSALETLAQQQPVERQAVQRFAQVAFGAGQRAAHLVDRVVEGRDHHDHGRFAAGVQQAVADLVAQRQAVRSAVLAQVDIDERDAIGVVGEQVEGAVAVAGQVDVEAVGLQAPAQEMQRHLAVVDQQHAGGDLRLAQRLALAAQCL